MEHNSNSHYSTTPHTAFRPLHFSPLVRLSLCSLPLPLALEGFAIPFPRSSRLSMLCE